MFEKCFLCLSVLCHCHMSLLPVGLNHKILFCLVYTTTGLPYRPGSLWKPPEGVRPHPQLDGEAALEQPGRLLQWEKEGEWCLLVCTHNWVERNFKVFFSQLRGPFFTTVPAYPIRMTCSAPPSNWVSFFPLVPEVRVVAMRFSLNLSNSGCISLSWTVSSAG